VGWEVRYPPSKDRSKDLMVLKYMGQTCVITDIQSASSVMPGFWVLKTKSESTNFRLQPRGRYSFTNLSNKLFIASEGCMTYMENIYYSSWREGTDSQVIHVASYCFQADSNVIAQDPLVRNPKIHQRQSCRESAMGSLRSQGSPVFDWILNRPSFLRSV